MIMNGESSKSYYSFLSQIKRSCGTASEFLRIHQIKQIKWDPYFMIYLITGHNAFYEIISEHTA